MNCKLSDGVFEEGVSARITVLGEKWQSCLEEKEDKNKGVNPTVLNLSLCLESG